MLAGPPGVLDGLPGKGGGPREPSGVLEGHPGVLTRPPGVLAGPPGVLDGPPAQGRSLREAGPREPCWLDHLHRVEVRGSHLEC